METAAENPAPSDWKLKLRYGRITTPYKHFTGFAKGRMRDEDNQFGCPVGPAWMAMKTWASDPDETADMMRVIGRDIGFEVTGDTLIYDTAPEQPPGDVPSGYDISFTPFKA